MGKINDANKHSHAPAYSCWVSVAHRCCSYPSCVTVESWCMEAKSEQEAIGMVGQTLRPEGLNPFLPQFHNFRKFRGPNLSKQSFCQRVLFWMVTRTKARRSIASSEAFRISWTRQVWTMTIIKLIRYFFHLPIATCDIITFYTGTFASSWVSHVITSCLFVCEWVCPGMYYSAVRWAFMTVVHTVHRNWLLKSST